MIEIPAVPVPERWVNREGQEVPLSDLDNNALLLILDRLYELAVTKKEMEVALYENMKGGYFQKQAERLHDLDWRDFVDSLFADAEYEAALRKLNWRPKPISPERKISLSARGSLERYLVGALRDAINAHGPVTKENASSAAKRMIGAIKIFNHDQRD